MSEPRSIKGVYIYAYGRTHKQSYAGLPQKELGVGTGRYRNLRAQGPGEISQPLEPDAFTHTFARTCARAGLEGVRVHDLRHAIATALMARVDPKLVSDTLGHASAAFTMDVYGHKRAGQVQWRLAL
jgi:integrase